MSRSAVHTIPGAGDTCARMGCDTTQNLIFPGAGSFLWWTAGTIQALQERLDLKHGNFSFYGASAGSVSCVMAACDVDMHTAMQLNFDLPSKSDGYTHGQLIEMWLHQMLPSDCHITCSGRVNISITTITMSFLPLHRIVVNTFSSKQDLIDACMASCHIPFFIDGNFSRTFHGHMCVDGSFLFLLHNTPWSGPEIDGNQRALLLYYHADKKLMEHHWGCLLSKLDKNSILEMFKLGYEYGTRLFDDGSRLFDGV
jgi:hypothetical protein